MANNLEVIFGANTDDLQRGIALAEKELKRLEAQKESKVVIGLDTSKLDKQIANTKANLEKLKGSLGSLGNATQGASKQIGNAGNTLTNFSRIAQDAPFGIIGIGNNLTATAEAFSSLSKQSGGAGNALKAVAGSLMGGGGILLAISLVTTALTVMSQKGITVGDVFDKLSGNFDGFKKSLSEANAEAAKTSGAEVGSLKALVATASDVSLSMRDRLIAVKDLQSQYPAYFGNLSQEKILNGDVAKSVKEATDALIAKAKASIFAGKIGELAAKEVPLREKEIKLIEEGNKAIAKRDSLLKQIESNKGDERLAERWAAAGRAVESIKDDLADVQQEIRGNISETQKWQEALNKNTKLSIATEFEPPKTKKAKKVKELQEQVNQIGAGLKPIGLSSLIAVDSGIFKSDIGMGKQIDAFIESLKPQKARMSEALIDFWMGIKSLQMSAITDTFGNIGDAIGNAMANGGSVIKAVGMSIVASMGSVLSSIGDKLIALGAASLLASTVFSTFGTALGVGAALAAIAGGVALKAGGSFLSSKGKASSGGGGSNPSVSAGNSVSSPTSSVNNGGGGSGWGNVVFEISGQSLIGVLSNTLSKNQKLGGVMPAI